MGDHGRGGGGSGGKRPAGGAGGAGAPVPDPADRPGASGHRFGPGLVCSECGVRWDAHQRSPHPCTVDLPHDPFARRPAPAEAVDPPRPIRPPGIEPGDGNGSGGAA